MVGDTAQHQWVRLCAWVYVYCKQNENYKAYKSVERQQHKSFVYFKLFMVWFNLLLLFFLLVSLANALPYLLTFHSFWRHLFCFPCFAEKNSLIYSHLHTHVHCLSLSLYHFSHRRFFRISTSHHFVKFQLCSYSFVLKILHRENTRVFVRKKIDLYRCTRQTHTTPKKPGDPKRTSEVNREMRLFQQHRMRWL